MTEQRREQLPDHPELSPVIGALRFTSDEVQLARVLAALCRDPAVAAPFCSAVLTNAQGGNAQLRDQLKPPPSDVTCVDEHVLETRLTRHRLKRRVAEAGRIDLDFTGDLHWRLFVELKIDSLLAPTQIERYSLIAPTAAVVRDPKGVERPRDRENWLGAASWASILPDLRALPVAKPARGHWSELLDVLVAAGDLDEKKPRVSREVLDARELLARISESATDHLRAELKRLYGESGKAAADRLNAGPVYNGSRWAGFPILTEGDDVWLHVDVCDVWTRGPRVRLRFNPLPDKRAWKRVRDALRASPIGPEFHERKHSFVLMRAAEATPETVEDRVLELIASQFTELAKIGVFADDVAGQDQGS